jgi:hypothetical protein
MEKKLLITLIVIGVLVVVVLPIIFVIGSLAYFGVLSPENIMPARCELSPPGLDCIATPYATENKIEFTVFNSHPYSLNEFELSSIEGVNCKNINVPENNINSGETKVITLTDCNLKSGERYMAEFVLTGKTEDGQTFSSNVLITNKVS